MTPKAPWEGAQRLIFQGLAHFAMGGGGGPTALPAHDPATGVRRPQKADPSEWRAGRQDCQQH